MRECAIEEKCIVNRRSECTALAQLLNIVPATSLGTDDEIKDAKRHFGKKLELVVDLIKSVSQRFLCRETDKRLENASRKMNA